MTRPIARLLCNLLFGLVAVVLALTFPAIAYRPCDLAEHSIKVVSPTETEFLIVATRPGAFKRFSWYPGPKYRLDNPVCHQCVASNHDRCLGFFALGYELENFYELDPTIVRCECSH